VSLIKSRLNEREDRGKVYAELTKDEASDARMMRVKATMLPLKSFSCIARGLIGALYRCNRVLIDER